MIFNSPPKLASQKNVAQYLQNQLWGWFQNIFNGLHRLDLDQNFRSTVVQRTIAAMTTSTFGNPLGIIPRYRLIVKQVGDGLITDGDWSATQLNLINNG